MCSPDLDPIHFRLKCRSLIVVTDHQVGAGLEGLRYFSQKRPCTHWEVWPVVCIVPFEWSTAPLLALTDLLYATRAGLMGNFAENPLFDHTTALDLRCSSRPGDSGYQNTRVILTSTDTLAKVSLSKRFTKFYLLAIFRFHRAIWCPEGKKPRVGGKSPSRWASQQLTVVSLEVELCGFGDRSVVSSSTWKKTLVVPTTMHTVTIMRTIIPSRSRSTKFCKFCKALKWHVDRHWYIMLA